MRASPRAHVCCKIVQVWEKQGIGRTGQIARRSLKIPTFSTSPAQYFNVGSSFSFSVSKTCDSRKKVLSPVLFHFPLPSFHLLWTRILICVLSLGDQHTHGHSNVSDSPAMAMTVRPPLTSLQGCGTVLFTDRCKALALKIWKNACPPRNH